MIERYTLPEMGAIWSQENKFDTWLKVEILACEAQAKLGVIPKQAVEEIKAKARYDIGRIAEIEDVVRHDVIAFLTSVAEYVGPVSRYIHLGMTSSDLLDTSLAYLLRQAGLLLQDRLRALRDVVGRRAVEHKYTPCIGRSHGIHAEPTTFGLKLAVWYDELGRAEKRLQQAIDDISYGKISGAVGTFAHIDPFVERYVCGKLGLKPAPASTQIVQRDRHAAFLTTLAGIGASLEKFATEVRNLQRTEILEVEEYFHQGQKGSSAMPHKRNPITCERVAGLARLLRGNAVAALENVALWHERDITHSSVERVILPDSTIVLDYMLHKFAQIMDKLIVYPENMRKNLERTGGLVFSQSILLELAKAGLTREKAYALVQKHAMASWEHGRDFKTGILSDPEIEQAIGHDTIESCFDLQNNLRHVDTIFERVGLKS
ncbi:MAG: adenylosuccinate lyase [candidate division KSB1 bacterium]|nr:adenylosuccinate lyase [candidate division KSB1 bacterium]MDQ7066053.1 adenylosuccinate lyase [candidate division KSB1 bacterium]